DSHPGLYRFRSVTSPACKCGVRYSTISSFGRGLDLRFVPFAFDPHFAVDEEFFFPDGDQSLQSIDSFQRGFKRTLPLLSRYDYGDAGFADIDPAEAMHPGDAADGESMRYFSANFGHNFDGHRLIAFVFKIGGGSAFGIIPSHAFEIDEGAVFAAQEALCDCS